MATLKVKKLHPDAQVPVCAHPGEDLGFDLYALEDTILLANQVRKVRTGVAVEMEGFGFIMRDRSSMSMKGIQVVGGTMDAGYRGEFFVNLVWRPAQQESMSYGIQKGERIAQFVPIKPFTGVKVVEVEELSASSRGAAGYGSSGK